MNYNVFKSIASVTNHFAALSNVEMSDTDKISNIRLNINFISEYPEFFHFSMNNPTDVFFGMCVYSKSQALKTEYLIGLSPEGDKQIRDHNPERAFEELASFWRMRQAQLTTIIPYVPLIMVRTMDEKTFAPKVSFKSRFGEVSSKDDA